MRHFLTSSHFAHSLAAVVKGCAIIGAWFTAQNAVVISDATLYRGWLPENGRSHVELGPELSVDAEPLRQCLAGSSHTSRQDTMPVRARVRHHEFLMP